MAWPELWIIVPLQLLHSMGAQLPMALLQRLRVPLYHLLLKKNVESVGDFELPWKTTCTWVSLQAHRSILSALGGKSQRATSQPLWDVSKRGLGPGS